MTIFLTLFTQNTPAYTVYLSLDKSTYNYGDTVRITGQVNATGSIPESVSEVRIVINDSSGTEYNQTLDFSDAEYLDAFGYGQNYGYGWGYSHLGLQSGVGYGYDEGSTTNVNWVYGDRGKLTYDKDISASSLGAGKHTAKIYVNGRLYAYRTFTVKEEEEKKKTSSPSGSFGISGTTPKVYFDLQFLSMVQAGYGSFQIPIKLKYSSSFRDTLTVTISPEGMPSGMTIGQKTVTLSSDGQWNDINLNAFIPDTLSPGNYSIWVRASGYSSTTGSHSGSIGVLVRVVGEQPLEGEEMEVQGIIEKINATGQGCLDGDCTYHPYVEPEVVEDNVIRLVVSSEFELTNITVRGNIPETINASLARVYLFVGGTYVDITDDPEYNVSIDPETGEFSLNLPHLSTQTLIITEEGVDVEEAVAEPEPEVEPEEVLETGITSEGSFEDTESGTFQMVLNNPLAEDCESCFLTIEIKDRDGNVVYTETRIVDVSAGTSISQDLEIDFEGYESGEFNLETALYMGERMIDEASKGFTITKIEVTEPVTEEVPEAAGFDWTLPAVGLGLLSLLGAGAYLMKRGGGEEAELQ